MQSSKIWNLEIYFYIAFKCNSALCSLASFCLLCQGIAFSRCPVGIGAQKANSSEFVLTRTQQRTTTTKICWRCFNTLLCTPEIFGCWLAGDALRWPLCFCCVCCAVLYCWFDIGVRVHHVVVEVMLNVLELFPWYFLVRMIWSLVRIAFPYCSTFFSKEDFCRLWSRSYWPRHLKDKINWLPNIASCHVTLEDDGRKTWKIYPRVPLATQIKTEKKVLQFSHQGKGC